VRFDAIARAREHVRVLAQKARRTAVAAFVLILLAVSLIVGKNIVLSEVSKSIRKSFAYESLKLSYFPPALVLENFRSQGDLPVVQARQVRIGISYVSLLRNRKNLTVVIDSPIIRLRPRAAAGAPRKARPPLSVLGLPFAIESGQIENGTVILERGQTLVEARGVRALVTQNGDAFAVRASAASSGYTSPDRGATPIGALTVLLAGRGEDMTVERLSVEGSGIALTAGGLVRNLFRPEVDLDVRYDVDTDILDDLLRMPFTWKGRAGGEGRLERKDGRLELRTAFTSTTLAIDDVPMGEIRGRFELYPDKRGELALDMQKPGRPAERLTLSFLKGRVEGQAAPVFVDPLMREVGVPWPIRSPAWGTFSVASRKVLADVEFRDADLERREDSFGLNGPVTVGVDLAKRLVDIDAPGLDVGFGRLEAKAAIDLGGDIDATIHAQVANVKNTRDFVALVLRQKFAFGEIRGRGYADAKLSGRSASPTVAIKATLSPGGFERFDAAFVEADLTISPAGFDGRFDVDDAGTKGRIGVRTVPDGLEIDVRDGEGDLERVLPALEIPISLAGRVRGDFRMVQGSAGNQEFSGTFTSPEIRGYGQTAGRVSGEIGWNEGVLSFPQLAMDFHGGRMEGRLRVGIDEGEFDVDARGEELDFASIVPSASGRLSLSLAGRGAFGQGDKLPGLFTIKDMSLSPLDRTEARGGLDLNVSGGQVRLGLKGSLVPGDNPFEGAFVFPFSGEPWTGTLTGRITTMDLIVPWDGAQGHVDYTADVRSTPEAAAVTVGLNVTAPVMPLPGFAYAVTDFTSAMTYTDGALTITTLAGKLGGGPLTGSGRVGIADGGIATMDLKLEGQDMVLSPIERLRAQAGGSLRILKDDKRFVTEGEVLFERMSYRREIYEPFGFSSHPATETSGPSFFDGMSLNLRLRADENCTIENSLGRFNARFNLTAVGAFDAPVLLGDINVISGDFFFQDRDFRVIRGRLSFTDPVNTEPYLDFRGETYVKDYRVTLDLSGPVDRLKPQFSSSPPLPPDEIMSLLALGEAFQRMYYSYSGDRSTAVNTASLLTYQIADLAKKGTGNLFSLDRLRIDPYLLRGGQGGVAARITVGKKVSKNLLFLYSTVLASSSVRAEIDEVPIFRMEWDISRRFSLVGGRDDRGRLGFDVKFRRRF
jgi:hypothetical protein